MSERGEVEVVMPLSRVPTPAEQKDLRREAFAEARRLVATVGGNLLGLSKTSRGVHAMSGDPCLKFTFAVDAPESTWARRRMR